MVRRTDYIQRLIWDLRKDRAGLLMLEDKSPLGMKEMAHYRNAIDYAKLLEDELYELRKCEDVRRGRFND